MTLLRRSLDASTSSYESDSELSSSEDGPGTDGVDTHGMDMDGLGTLVDLDAPLDAPSPQPPSKEQMRETRSRPIPPGLQRDSDLAIDGDVVEKVKHVRKHDANGKLTQDKLTTRLKANRHVVGREGSRDPTLGVPGDEHEVANDLVLKGEYSTEPGRVQTIETTAPQLSPNDRALLGHHDPMTRRTKQMSTAKRDGVSETKTTRHLARMSKEQKETLGMKEVPSWPLPAPQVPDRPLPVKEEHKTTTNGHIERDQDIVTQVMPLSEASRLAVGIEHDRPLTERSKHVVKREGGEVVEDKTTRNLRQMPAKLRERLGVQGDGAPLQRGGHDFVPDDLIVKDEHKISRSGDASKEQWIDTSVVALSDEDRLAMGMNQRAPLTRRTKRVVTDDGRGKKQDKHTTKLSGMSKKVRGLLGIVGQDAPLPGSSLHDGHKLLLKSEHMTQTTGDRRKEQRITSTLKMPPEDLEAHGSIPWVERRKHVDKYEGDQHVGSKDSTRWRPMRSKELQQYGYDLSGDANREARRSERRARRRFEEEEKARKKGKKRGKAEERGEVKD